MQYSMLVPGAIDRGLGLAQWYCACTALKTMVSINPARERQPITGRNTATSTCRDRCAAGHVAASQPLWRTGDDGVGRFRRTLSTHVPHTPHTPAAETGAMNRLSSRSLFETTDQAHGPGPAWSNNTGDSAMLSGTVNAVPRPPSAGVGRFSRHTRAVRDQCRVANARQPQDMAVPQPSRVNNSSKVMAPAGLLVVTRHATVWMITAVA